MLQCNVDLSRTAGIVRYQASHNQWFQAAGIAVLVFIIYFVTSHGSTAFNHFVRLADAFLDGRLYLLDAPANLELARYGEKAFVINPPAPTLFVLPWVAIWGISTNQTIVCMIVGSASIGLFWVAATQMRWGLPLKAAITLLLAFGTNFWWAATDGSLWTFAHVSAVFFLMAALVETTGRNRPWLVGILVGLAGLSRLTTFLTSPFFAYTVAQGAEGRRIIIRRLAVFGLALAAMVGVYLAYNYGRYETFSDQGYYHPQYLTEPWFAKGRFDISYIPRHVEAILFKGPVITEEFPFFKPSSYGLGLFFTTPALLYIFRAELRGLPLAALVAVLLTAVIWMIHGTTGWAQFGYRYSMDILPFMAILVASGMRYRLDRLKIAVILLSCAINLWGTLSFHKLDWGA